MTVRTASIPAMALVQMTQATTGQEVWTVQTGVAMAPMTVLTTLATPVPTLRILRLRAGSLQKTQLTAQALAVMDLPLSAMEAMERKAVTTAPMDLAAALTTAPVPPIMVLTTAPMAPVTEPLFSAMVLTTALMALMTARTVLMMEVTVPTAQMMALVASQAQVAVLTTPVMGPPALTGLTMALTEPTMV